MVNRSRTLPVAKQVAAWTAVAACALYAAFAVGEAVSEILVLVGLTPGEESRAAPPLFVLHTLTGAIALLAAALQLRLAGRLLQRTPQAHRAIGKVYVGAAWVTSVAGLGTAAWFDVGPVGLVVFAGWAAFWFAATTVAVRHVRAGRIPLHRTWMIRSVALALVFGTFSLVQPAVATAATSRAVIYPLALLISVGLNLAVAEGWLRTRGRFKPSGATVKGATSGPASAAANT